MFKKPQLWFGIVFNLILAALVISGTAIYVVHRRGSIESGKIKILEIRDSASGRVYGKWPLYTGEFSVEFVHSVNQSPVRESFRAEGKNIRPAAVRFSSFGAGMLSDLSEAQTMSRDGDAMVITGFTNTFTELNYIVGTVSDHLLLINGETVSLRDLCGKNAHVTMRIK